MHPTPIGPGRTAPAEGAHLLAGLAAHFALALVAIHLSRQPGGIATLWYANAAGTVLLLHAGARRALGVLALLLASNLLANLVTGDALVRSLAFLPANGLEMALGAWLLGRTGAWQGATTHPGRLGAAMLLGGGLPTLAGALLGAGTLAWQGAAVFGDVWPRWMEGSLIGTASVLPLALHLLGHGPAPLLARLRPRPLLALALCTGTTVLVPMLLPYPFVYMVLPLMLLATWQDFPVTALALLLASLALGLTGLAHLVPAAGTAGWDDLLHQLPILAMLLPPAFLAAAVEGRRAALAALAAEKELTEITLHSIGDGVVSTDADGRVRYLNPVAEAMIGWTRAEATGRPFGEVVPLFDQDSGDRLDDPVARCLHERRPAGLPASAMLRNRQGTDCAIQDSVAPIYAGSGELQGAVMVFQDVSQTRALMQRMSYLAQHDALTGLPNRVLLRDRIEQACQLHARHGGGFCVAFLDLDHFKHVNDSLGHAMGDELLRAVAGRLKTALRASDTISRQGGDEFVLLLADANDTETVGRLADKLLAVLTAPLRLSGTDLRPSGSIGIARYPQDGRDVETLTKHADTAMYRAKREGRNRWQLYSPSADRQAAERLALESDLRRAIESDQFTVHFQPLVDYASGRITGVEALARWQRYGKRAEPPSVFIPVAEESRLIVPLGRLVLERACAAFARFQAAGHALETLAVNVSPVQLAAPDFVETVALALERARLRPGCLELEITETSLLDASARLRPVLDALDRLGVRLSIDDFGTGYSSLSYLRHLRARTLKIDRSFVTDMMESVESRRIVSTIISLARNLDQGIVAEGVETVEQAEALFDLGCDTMQGYLFSPPVPEDTMRVLLREGLGGR